MEIFRSNKIDCAVLLELDRDDMSELGIVAFGDRKKLQKMILRLKASGRDTAAYTRAVTWATPSVFVVL